MALRRRRMPDRRNREAGQTLVEFALVFPIFLVLLFAIIEFAFVFSAMLGISYATRDAALLTAEAGSALGADCLAIRTVEQAVSAPADDARIQSVVIYRANPDGTEILNVSNTWTRTGSTNCATAFGSITIPYTMTVGNERYKDTTRCNVLAGCATNASGAHPGPDTIGVRITYTHQWVTPMGGFGGLGGSGYTLTQSNSMRMEPVL